MDLIAAALQHGAAEILCGAIRYVE
jgi:hypothetical protein